MFALVVVGSRPGTGGVTADVLEHAAQEGGESEDLSGPEEGEGVVLDERGPIALVGVEGMQEMVLDSKGGRLLAMMGGGGNGKDEADVLGNVSVPDEDRVYLGPEIRVLGCGSVPGSRGWGFDLLSHVATGEADDRPKGRSTWN